MNNVVLSALGLSLLDLPSIYIVAKLFSFGGDVWIVEFIILGTLQWFIIGSLFGGLYGKIKSEIKSSGS